MIEDLNISEINPPLNQLRTVEDLDDLTRSISQKGLLQPIIVRTIENRNLYEIVAGFRRFSACKNLGWRKLPCQIIELTDKEAFEVSIMENVQRKTLNPMEEAKAFKTYVCDNGWGGVTELATKLGKSAAYVTKRIMLLDLPSEVTKAINESSIRPSVAQELLYLEKQDEKSKLAKLIIERHLTIKSVRSVVKELSHGNNHDESDLANKVDEVRAKRSYDRSILALRIAMNRIGAIINDIEDDWVLYEMLMQHKRRLNEQIDLLIKQKKKWA
jgi:ParB family chromosome partitioning protein